MTGKIPIKRKALLRSVANKLRLSQRNTNMKASRPYEETLTDILRTPEDMTAYLNESMQDEDPRVFLLALQDVVRMQGMSQVSRKAGVNRQALYKALSGERNPRVDTLNKVLHALGLRLAVEKAA